MNVFSIHMVKISLDAKWSGFECHLNTGQPNQLNTVQMDAISFSYVLVQYSNGRSSSYRIAHRPTI